MVVSIILIFIANFLMSYILFGNALMILARLDGVSFRYGDRSVLDKLFA